MAKTKGNAAGVSVSGDDVSVNLAGVDENQEYPLLPRGTYDAVVVSSEHRVAASSGNHMWALRFEVDHTDIGTVSVFHNIVFAPKALPRCKRDLKALGMDNILETEFDPRDESLYGELEGVACQIRVDIRKGTGDYKDANSVKQIYPEGSQDTSGGSDGAFA